MDSSLISVEGRMIGQNLDGSRHFKLAMDMSIYARPSLRHVLEPALIWATTDHRGFDYMRSLQARGASGPVTPKSQKDPRFRGNGQMLGAGLGQNIGGSSTGAYDERMMRLLEGLKRVGDDEKQADHVMVWYPVLIITDGEGHLDSQLRREWHAPTSLSAKRG